MSKAFGRLHRLGTRFRAQLVLGAAITPLWFCEVGEGADKNWKVDSGNWNLNGNWTPVNIPVAGDSVRIVNADTTNRLVTLNVITPVLLDLTIDNTGTGTDILAIGGAFQLSTSGSETIGLDGSGSVSQTSGGNSVGGNLQTWRGDKGIGNVHFVGRDTVYFFGHICG